MSILIPFVELINYCLYSILAGYIALQFVPNEYKPITKVSKKAILLLLLGIYICSFGPVVQVISYFSDSVGFALATYSVLTDFQVGRAWISTGFLTVFLWLTIVLNGSKYIQAILLLFMVLSVGYASHVASLSFWSGLIAHSAHFLVISLWVGVLIHVAWFSNDQEKWSKFLKWFTPFAVVSLVIIFISGFSLMKYIVEPKDYVSSWVLPYGQMLLLKHISIIPLLIFALINGLLLKRVHGDSLYNPRPWIKAEGLIILITFYFTSIMGTLSPPHDVDFTVKSEGASKWVEWLLGKEIVTTMNVGLKGNFPSILMMVLSLLFIGMIFVSMKRINPLSAVFFGVSFIFTMYFGIMMIVSI
ncbi:CopD family protein [Robertmurraya korlensis]|uniref:copper resistance D family protein n=1 Tax=Robertmurraya korlensis TaxID=519977 RepID=UPI0020424633|nr:CopD family protein [Robertmurraya korlensis]MCM3601778.1 CopD family protein [Robertmurraya korlensis]